MRRKIIIILITLFFIFSVIIWWRTPIIGNEWSKQTLYVSLIDAWHGSSTDKKAYAMWIDDDSSKGVFIVKKISDALGIHPCYAVIADRMEPEVADSIASWQQQGDGIVLHGYRHERWWDWDKHQIEQDIKKSYKRLEEQGFDTAKILKMIIPPHGCNTRIIRQVIQQHGCQMISGATLVNPNRHVFQLGRIAITKETDTVAMRHLLQKAYERKGFIIFSTHSSIPAIFSEKRTQQILEMAKEIGFDFNFYD